MFLSTTLAVPITFLSHFVCIMRLPSVFYKEEMPFICVQIWLTQIRADLRLNKLNPLMEFTKPGHTDWWVANNNCDNRLAKVIFFISLDPQHLFYIRSINKYQYLYRKKRQCIIYYKYKVKNRQGRVNAGKYKLMKRRKMSVILGKFRRCMLIENRNSLRNAEGGIPRKK